MASGCRNLWGVYSWFEGLGMNPQMWHLEMVICWNAWKKASGGWTDGKRW